MFGSPGVSTGAANEGGEMSNDEQVRKGIGACAIATIIGVALPWASVLIVSVSGFDTDYGKAVIAGAGFGGALAFAGKLKGAWNLLAPLFNIGMIGWFLVKLSHVEEKPNALFPVHVNIGFGVWLALFASVMWILLVLRDVSQRNAAKAAKKQATQVSL
jgi:hypothetical protein